MTPGDEVVLHCLGQTIRVRILDLLTRGRVRVAFIHDPPRPSGWPRCRPIVRRERLRPLR